MTYQEALEFIHGIPRMGPKPGLARMKRLLGRLGNPQNKQPYVHVAGTNGKGSTCTMLSCALAASGLRTGLFLSPFVVDFRERIQLDNRWIPQAELARLAQLVKPHWQEMAAEGEMPSEFEVVTAIAFCRYAQAGCDVVVLETGMGGLTDATNIIGTPLVSVITNIGLDHMAYLGDTLEEIAHQKCGIIKPGGVTVSYPRQDPGALGVIMEHCAQKNNRLLMGLEAELLETGPEGSSISYGGQELFVPLAGRHQIWNAVTVLETLGALRDQGIVVGKEAAAEGIAGCMLPARFELLCRDPLVVLDGAHNEAGAEALANSLGLLGKRPVFCVVGMMADKEAEKALAQVLPHCQKAWTVTPQMPGKALAAEALAHMAAGYCGRVEAAQSLEQALAAAMEACGPQGAVVIWGSLYLAGQARELVLGPMEEEE